METPDRQLGEAGPYAVYYTRRRPDGSRFSCSPVRNLRWATAVDVRDLLVAEPAVIEVHISADTCG